MAPEPEPELDMSKAEDAYAQMPSHEDNTERLEYMEGLDTETLQAIEKRGVEEGDMYNLMDAALAGIELEARNR